MAFVFRVENGTGLADATSYASVQEAEDYLTPNIHVAPKWLALSFDKQEGLLSFASRTLDYRVRWNGEKAVATSALRFPRTGLVDTDGTPIPSNVVPKAVKAATIEVAATMIDADRTAERSSDGLKELQVDVIRIVFDEDYRLPVFGSTISHILSGYGSVSSGRRGFKRILKA